MKKFFAFALMAFVGVVSANAQKVLYSEDYEEEECTQENVAQYWTRSPDKAPLNLITDSETGNKYWESVMSNGKSRYLYTRWTTDPDALYGDHKKYTLEFDAALQKGTMQTWQELAIMSEGATWPFNDKRSNEGIFYTKQDPAGYGCLFDLIGDASGKATSNDAEVPLDGKYYVNNDLEDLIDLPMAGWCHFKFDIDAENMKMACKIVDSSTNAEVLSRDFDLDDYTGVKPIGIYVENTKNNGTFRIDNIKITATDGVVDGVQSLDLEQQPGVFYNLQGCQVSKPTQAGIYICQGKKIVTK